MFEFWLWICGWLVGWVVTVVAWRLCDDRIFGRYGNDPENVTGGMVLFWPLYLAMLVIWMAICLLIIVPILLVGQLLQKAPAS